MLLPLRTLVVAGCLVTLSPAQAVSLSARAQTDLTIDTLTNVHGSRVDVVAGTPLLNGASWVTQPSLFGDACSLACTLVPTPNDRRFRMTWLSTNFLAQSINTVSGEEMLTLTTPAGTTTAVRLVCSYSGTTGYFLTTQLGGTVDVNADGTFELQGSGPTTISQTVPAVVTSAGLPVRTSIGSQTWGASGNHAVRLDVVVQEVLSATVTPYVTGCGPAIDARPTPQSELEVAVQGLPTSGLAALLIGPGRDNVSLPCGACVLGVRAFQPLLLATTPRGTSGVVIAVPPRLLPVTVDLQAVHLDPSPCAIATSDAIEVRLSR